MTANPPARKPQRVIPIAPAPAAGAASAPAMQRRRSAFQVGFFVLFVLAPVFDLFRYDLDADHAWLLGMEWRLGLDPFLAGEASALEAAGNIIVRLFVPLLGVAALVIGVVVTILTAVIIFGGLRSIARFSELAVPFMAVGYLVVAVGILLVNLGEVPGVLAMIVKSAFGFHEAAAGGIGAAILNGFKRGLFSNEAGMGSAPNAAAAATPYPPHPASQGYVQMAGVFIDTMLICTASAAIILLAGPVEGTGISLVQNALTAEVGGWGKYFLAIVVLFFAFTSIVANYFYAENCLVFIEHNHPAGLLIFRLMVLAMVMFGAVGSLPFVWNFADVAMGLMAITNLIAILLLSGLAVKLARDYDAQRAAGKLPTFDASRYPEIRNKLEPGIWD